MLISQNINFYVLKLFIVDCISVKRLSNVVTDGDYSVRVFGPDNSYTQVTMYCAFMSGATPKEYLTLPSGGSNNYVSLSWKDTICDVNSDDGKCFINHFDNS